MALMLQWSSLLPEPGLVDFAPERPDYHVAASYALAITLPRCKYGMGRRSGGGVWRARS